MEYFNGQAEIFIKVNTRKMKETDMVKYTGRMVAVIKENGLRAFSMATGKCFSQMAQKVKDTLRTTFTK